MKPNDSHQPDATHHSATVRVASALRRQAATLIERARTAIFSEFRRGLEDYEHLLRLAMNEAEALAWQTDYPHLLFPTLAAEKAQAVANWQSHQHFLKRTRSSLALAA
jgi:hypothetical protein